MCAVSIDMYIDCSNYTLHGYDMYLWYGHGGPMATQADNYLLDGARQRKTRNNSQQI
ncbi:hypothetical protein TcasGA2_TC032123 [Tribolium castaneum]|uniref:Uncharacterized protein n=1 Tax=Tribolium castaneum TaxID=7070 RepID=A0A139WMV6_TRICA|nr:hypothetical protein TcasGA2_TC032123 [Tribolium castaneum]